jgi:hypothetical protein
MMKRQCIGLVLILSLGALSWGTAQTVKTDLFDVRKSQQELEIMKGILSTTLGFVARELQAKEAPVASTMPKIAYGFRGWSSNITAFYLYGQGATFVVPMSGFRFAYTKAKLVGAVGDFEPFKLESDLLADSVDAMAHMQGELAERERDVMLVQLQARALAESAAAVAPQAPATPAPPQAPPPAAAPVPTPRPDRDESVRRRLAEAQEEVKKRREETEQRRQRMLESVAQIKVYLIEALANHGDSLTHVRPNEYINIVITSEEFGDKLFFDSTDRGGNDVISVQKSIVTDYKAGRLTLDAFKQKVLQYTN